MLIRYNEMIRKLILYLPFNFNKIEKYLQAMDQAGYRLTQIKLLFWFYFVPAKDKHSKYYFTYSMPRERGMVDYDISLKRQNAEEIKTSLFYGATLYRICDLETPLEEMISFRSSYLIKSCIRIILLLLCQSALFLFGFFYYSGNNVFRTVLLVLSIAISIFLLCFVVNLPVLIFLGKNSSITQ